LIELIVLDVDGCLSDGKITYLSTTEEIKSFNVKDGLAITSWIKLGKKVAIITGRSSKIVQKRADELGIEYLFQGVKNKLEKLDELLDNLGLTRENVAAIGDDLNDYKMLKSVKNSFTPKDGVDEIKEIVDVVLSKNGGDGAVREMIDILIKEDSKLQKRFKELWI